VVCGRSQETAAASRTGTQIGVMPAIGVRSFSGAPSRT